MKKFFLTFAFLFFAAALKAAPPVLLNDTEITVGDNIFVQLSAQEVDLEALSKSNFGDFTLRAAQINEGGNLILTLAAFKTGILTLPPVLGAQSLDIEITSVLDPDSPPYDILDIKPIIIFARGALFYLILFAIIVLAIIASCFIYKYLQKRKIEKEKQTPETTMLPREFALMELEKLKTSKLAPKEYYDKLSDIVRYYVSRIYGADCLEKTTAEIFNALRTMLAPADNAALRSLLQTCDFVKFAKFTPSENDTRSDLEAAKELVEKL